MREEQGWMDGVKKRMENESERGHAMQVRNPKNCWPSMLASQLCSRLAYATLVFVHEKRCFPCLVDARWIHSAAAMLPAVVPLPTIWTAWPTTLLQAPGCSGASSQLGVATLQLSRLARQSAAQAGNAGQRASLDW